MPEDTTLALTLPGPYAQATVGQILEAVFPADEPGLLVVDELLDVAENPDLPDIYDCLLPIFDQYRLGWCYLTLRTDSGSQVELSDPVATHCHFDHGATPTLSLIVEPEYRALDYVAAQDDGGDKTEFLDWLRACLLIYFLDKHECQLTSSEKLAENETLWETVQNLVAQDLLALSGEPEVYSITPAGRRFIGLLLAETEGYIDRFDLFKDALWNPDTQSTEFDTGYGEDLRVSAFITEGINPGRAVFLLRLYDGTMDQFASNGLELMGDEAFFNQILEPVVNRCLVPDELLPRILADGWACLDAQAEFLWEAGFQGQVARRVRAGQ